MIPNIATWLQRKHGEVNFHLTQFLSGHGGYRSYLHRFGHDDSNSCPVCDVQEDPQHAFFECPRFENERSRLNMVAGENLKPNNIVDAMIRSETVWNAVCDAVVNIQRRLRHFEARRHAEGGNSRQQQ